MSVKHNAKSFTAILAATLLLGGFGIIMSDSIDEAFAANEMSYTRPNEVIDSGAYTHEIKGLQGIKQSSYYTVSFTGTGSTSGDSLSVTASTGKLTVTGNLSGGIYEITLKGPMMQGNIMATWTWTVTAVKHTTNVTFNVGDSAVSDRIVPGTSVVSGDVPGVTFSSAFASGQYFITSQGTYTKEGTFEIMSNAGNVVKYTINAPMLDMPYTAPSSNAVANKNWTYNPTPISGIDLTVSGVDWLFVNDNTIYGIPPDAGAYDITIKMAKPGYEERTETFTLTVVSELIVLNSPGTGAIVFVR
ncbi:MAG TPA: hypothetical protein VJY42_02280 [Candidatus Methanomethylophilaceae archaeon]|nr:hypothetical protein [Candidatus Methanomethylophilaceae archaeon]